MEKQGSGRVIGLVEWAGGGSDVGGILRRMFVDTEVKTDFPWWGMEVPRLLHSPQRGEEFIKAIDWFSVHICSDLVDRDSLT